mmetsp:Transcript_123251/g.356071  ORF Transcript_123251/g.356071 Transcript_123251/m.356071 type:complete len:235 (-) Transcript_123251:205-909(-)
MLGIKAHAKSVAISGRSSHKVDTCAALNQMSREQARMKRSCCSFVTSDMSIPLINGNRSAETCMRASRSNLVTSDQSPSNAGAWVELQDEEALEVNFSTAGSMTDTSSTTALRPRPPSDVDTRLIASDGARPICMPPAAVEFTHGACRGMPLQTVLCREDVWLDNCGAMLPVLLNAVTRISLPAPARSCTAALAASDKGGLNVKVQGPEVGTVHKPVAASSSNEGFGERGSNLR